MSQFYLNSNIAGPVPPTVPTSFVTQDGTAVPAANILIVNGFDSSENNDNGIISKGGVAGTGTANEVDVVITNRQTGQSTTSDATLTTILTFTPAVAGVYSITGTVTGYIPATNDGGSYFFSDCVISNGAATSSPGGRFTDFFETAGMAASNVAATEVGNTYIVQVEGVAGTTINWDALIEYRKVS